jgi:FLVCR family MFS transporter
MNVSCLIFLVVPDIPGVGHLWVNWVLMGSCVFAVIFMLFFKEDYRRLNLDYGKTYTLPDNAPINASS